MEYVRSRSDANTRFHQPNHGHSAAFSSQSTVTFPSLPGHSFVRPLTIRLTLKRALPEQCSNRIEHLMTSENVLIRFANCENQQIDPTDFNEENIRNYFQTYGTILNLYLLKRNRCVIEFQDYGEFRFCTVRSNV